MARGQASVPGDTRVAPNGYHYTRTESKWELTHKLVWEEANGRKLADDERLRFKDRDRTNLSPDNIVMFKKRPQSAASRRARLEAKIEAMQAELETLAE